MSTKAMAYSDDQDIEDIEVFAETIHIFLLVCTN